MEKKLHVLVCQLFGYRSYPNFDQKLRELKGVPLMHSIWAVRTAMTAPELKEVLRRTLDNGDRILVVEVAGSWASRRAPAQPGRDDSPTGRPGACPLEAALGRVRPRMGPDTLAHSPAQDFFATLQALLSR